MKIARFTICLLSIGIPVAWSQQPATPIYQNEKAKIPERVRDLLGRMTLEEKVAQLQSGVNILSLDWVAWGSQSSFGKGESNEPSAKKTLGKARLRRTDDRPFPLRLTFDLVPDPPDTASRLLLVDARHLRWSPFDRHRSLQ